MGEPGVPDYLHWTSPHGITGGACREAGSAYPLVDGAVLAAVELLVEVEDPHGRAGVEAVVVEHAVNGHVLPRTYHHFLRDVAHLCKHTHCIEDNVNVDGKKNPNKGLSQFP